ncbi:hypothetical protein Ocin01_13843 [Orchesella cincta]|uniref:Uncharacterized protein n=1 Tax=Orchesella cincta TaxID=48709 RepID=A0A1D2MIL2_ORCCI|nr:hypothetical protein Ocin01_13843 [Orchesella cincta]
MMETRGKQERTRKDGEDTNKIIASQSSRLSPRSRSVNGNDIVKNSADNFAGTSNNRNNLKSHLNFGDRNSPTNGLSSSAKETEDNAPSSGLLNTQKLDQFLDHYEWQHGLESMVEKDVQNLTTILSLIKSRNSSYKKITQILRDRQIRNLTSNSTISSLDSKSSRSRSPQNNNPGRDNGNLKHNNGKASSNVSHFKKNPVIREEEDEDDSYDFETFNERKEEDSSVEEIEIVKERPISNRLVASSASSNGKVNTGKSSQMKTTVSVLRYANNGKSQEVNVNANKTVDDVKRSSKIITSETLTKKAKDSERINTNTEMTKSQATDKKNSAQGSFSTPQRKPQHIDNSKNAVRPSTTSQDMRECARKLVTNRTFIKAPSEPEKSRIPLPPPPPISTSPSISSAGAKKSSKTLLKSKIPVPLPKTKSKSVKEEVKATDTSCSICSTSPPGAVVNTLKTLSEKPKSSSPKPAPASNNSAQQVQTKADGKAELERVEILQKTDEKPVIANIPIQKSFEHLNPEKSRVLHGAKADVSLVPRKKHECGAGDEISDTLDLIEGLSGHTSWVMKKLLEYPKSEQELKQRFAKVLKEVPDIGEFFGVPYIQKEARGHYFFGRRSLPSMLGPPRL